MAEFYDPTPAADLGDPATDPPMVVRVHPDDDPRDPRARRAIKSDVAEESLPWQLVTGKWRRAAWIASAEVADWPVTHPVIYCTAHRHALHRAGAEQDPERGDMDVTAFRTHADDA